MVPGRISQHRQETTPQAVRTDWKYRIPLNMSARKRVRYYNFQMNCSFDLFSSNEQAVLANERSVLANEQNHCRMYCST